MAEHHIGMVYKIRPGISRRDMPERYGPWQTVYTRYRRYALDGVFSRALQQIQARSAAARDIDWLVRIHSTIVRAHRPRQGEADDHTLGRSRGGLTTTSSGRAGRGRLTDAASPLAAARSRGTMSSTGGHSLKIITWATSHRRAPRPNEQATPDARPPNHEPTTLSPLGHWSPYGP
ncbi:transposase [Streptomyces mutabilis]|uniref:transposase n=1 Tax=Streptomyces mutabilis TaxID=67332 RepID=UPI00379A157B